MSPADNQWLEDAFPTEILPFKGTCYSTMIQASNHESRPSLLLRHPQPRGWVWRMMALKNDDEEDNDEDDDDDDDDGGDDADDDR